MIQPPSKTQIVGESDQRPFGRQGLFELHAAEHVSLSTNDLAELVARRSFPFLIPTDGICAARKEAFVERKVIRRTAKAVHNAVTEPQVQDKPAANGMMPGGSDLYALVVGVSAQVSRRGFQC